MMLALLLTSVALRANGHASAEVAADGPYAVHPAVDANAAADVFETTLVAQAATVEIGDGVSAKAWTFNGLLPGPEIRVRVGDTVMVHYRNELPLPSAIHWHGIELNNAADGTELTQNTVPSGGSFLYKFIVPRPGVFWYHPHHHPTNQVFRGMYGSLIVTDAADDILVSEGVLPPRERTKTLMLSDITVCKEPGQNDDDTYDDSLPWAGGGPLPEQPGPFPADLCDQPMDDHGNPILGEDGRPIPLNAGEIPNIQRPVPEHGVTSRINEGQTVLTNGKAAGPRPGSPEAPGSLGQTAEVLDVAAGQGLRLQAINAATTRYFRLLLTDAAGRRIPLVRVGGEGGLLDTARVEGNTGEGTLGVTVFDAKHEQGEIVIGPSDRADFVVAVPREAAAGAATLWTLDFRRTGTDGWSRVPTVPVMHLNVTPPTSESYSIAEGTPLRTHGAVADPVEALGPPPSIVPDLSGAVRPLLDPATFTPRKEGSASEDIRLTTSGNMTSIDSTPGTHDSAVDYTAVPHTRSTRYARLGDLLELTVTNTTGAHHPFHLHGFSFQPLSLEGVGSVVSTKPTYTFDYREFVDTIDIPGFYRLRFRVRLDDRPQMDGVTPGGGLGRWVFHCHIFFHATFGMHSELVVVAPDGNEKPFVNADQTRVEVEEGSSATTTGTHADPDGDPLTLQASSGAVRDLGNGRWSWSAAPGDIAPGTRTVHVTATDDTGFSGQAAFDLHIENQEPTVTLASPPSGSLFLVGSTVTVTATVSDAGSSQLSCRFDWDDGAGPGASVPAAGAACSDSRVVAEPGVRTVVVTVSDPQGATASASTLFAVHDPHGGFVTGSGTAAPGSGAFDLSVRYPKEATAPAGTLNFVDQVEGIDFAATTFDWLVVAGAKAQVRGSGRNAGTDGYQFLLTAFDNPSGPDALRMKLWEARTGTVVYDNAPDRPDDIDTAGPPPVSQGSVVVHRR